jgi:hypothetical protein
MFEKSTHLEVIYSDIQIQNRLAAVNVTQSKFLSDWHIQISTNWEQASWRHYKEARPYAPSECNDRGADTSYEESVHIII